MIFIDTGAFIARFRSSDDYHSLAVKGWAELRRSSARMFTSNIVLLETAKLLAAMKGYRWASSRLAGWLSSEELTVIHSSLEDEIQAVELMARYADQRIGPADCVSFVLMRQQGIKKCFAFDRHFRIAGFDLWPGESRK